MQMGHEGRAINALGTKLLAFVCQQGHARYTTNPAPAQLLLQRMLLGVDEEAYEETLWDDWGFRANKSNTLFPQ